MSRYSTEFDRLYAPLAAAPKTPSPGAEGLIGPDGQVRALVLDLGRPVEWPLVASLWRTVQENLDLPAAGIAISGEQSFQLWWSLAEAVPAEEGERFLQALQRRFLPAVKPDRVRTFPSRTGADPRWTHARRVPEQVMPDQWSAFVAPGLAPVFEETPWVDFPPNEDGQAELLSGLRSVTPEQWKDAWERLAIGDEDRGGRANDTAARTASGTPAAGGEVVIQAGAHVLADRPANALSNALSNVPVAIPAGSPADRPSTIPGAIPADSAEPVANFAAAPALVTQSFNDPRRFLLHVMNDSAVPLPLRIEAAKALLPYTVDR